jgi:cell wall-associated NlpC family hydrolase
MRAEEAAGISIPRTSQMQWAALRHVRHPKPGDLVFFVGEGDGGTMTAPGHVGIVVNRGKKLMIDAPAPGSDVREESWAGWSGFVGFADPGGK